MTEELLGILSVNQVIVIVDLSYDIMTYITQTNKINFTGYFKGKFTGSILL